MRVHGSSAAPPAQAQADLIAERARQEVLDSQAKGDLRRLLMRERWEQANLDAIGQIANQQLLPDGTGKPVSCDWAATFRDSSKNISDPEMRILWGKLLAGELFAPGSFSRKTMDTLRMLSPEDARTFNRLCSFIWLCDGVERYIFTQGVEYIERFGFVYDDLVTLIDAGLVSPADKLCADFFPDRTYQLSYKGATHYLMSIVGRPIQHRIIPLTKAGQEISRLCDPLGNEDYYSAIRVRTILKSF